LGKPIGTRGEISEILVGRLLPLKTVPTNAKIAKY
jgi:hypothetical protein